MCFSLGVLKIIKFDTGLIDRGIVFRLRKVRQQFNNFRPTREIKCQMRGPSISLSFYLYYCRLGSVRSKRTDNVW